MRRAGHMTSTGEENKGFWLGKLKERTHLEHLDADGSITLKWTSQSRMGVS
jgi:hypothetical protein